MKLEIEQGAANIQTISDAAKTTAQQLMAEIESIEHQESRNEGEFAGVKSIFIKKNN